MVHSHVNRAASPRHVWSFRTAITSVDCTISSATSGLSTRRSAKRNRRGKNASKKRSNAASSCASMLRTRRRSSKSVAISKPEACYDRHCPRADNLVDGRRLADVDDALRHASLDEPRVDGDAAAGGNTHVGGSQP